MPERAVLGQARMMCSSALLVHIKMVSSRTPIEKKGARRQKGGPSDCGPVVGLRKEPDRERPKPKNPKAQGPRGPGPDDRTKERHAEASDRQTRRRDGETSGRAGRRASRHKEDRETRHTHTHTHTQHTHLHLHASITDDPMST